MNLFKTVKYFTIISGLFMGIAFYDTGPAYAADAWQKRCDAKDKQGIQHCEIAQQLLVKNKDQEGAGQRFVEVAIGYPKSAKEPEVVFILPLGIRVDAPVEVTAAKKGADKKLMELKISHCTQKGCFASVSTSAYVIETLKASENMTIHLMAPNKKKVNVELSLSGFTKGIDSIRN